MNEPVREQVRRRYAAAADVAAGPGCGNPLTVVELQPGERVLDLGSGGEDHLSVAERPARGSHVGCIAGALSRREYLDGLAAAGFVAPEVVFSHEVAPQLHAAVVRAVEPSDTAA